MTTPPLGSPRRHRPLFGLLVLVPLLAFLASPVSAQAGSGVGIDVSPELLGVMVDALVPSAAGEAWSTKVLLSSLTIDPQVRRVLDGLGATDVKAKEAWPPSPWDLERVQAALAGGAPSWLAEAIQVSVDRKLPVVTPLNVLLVLVRRPDADTVAFLREHGLESQAVETSVTDALQEMSGLD